MEDVKPEYTEAGDPEQWKAQDGVNRMFDALKAQGWEGSPDEASPEAFGSHEAGKGPWMPGEVSETEGTPTKAAAYTMAARIAVHHDPRHVLELAQWLAEETGQQVAVTGIPDPREIDPLAAMMSAMTAPAPGDPRPVQRKEAGIVQFAYLFNGRNLVWLTHAEITNWDEDGAPQPVLLYTLPVAGR